MRSAKALGRSVDMERSSGKRGQGTQTTVHRDVHLPRVTVGRSVKNKTKRDARVSSNDIFPVAGIGCSAGGVEALQFFFQNMPPDSGIAFIVVSHLARDYHSLLPEIVARHARMPVTTALDGETIEPNTVYICPPNHILQSRKAHIAAHAPPLRSAAQTDRRVPWLARGGFRRGIHRHSPFRVGQ